jgi:predicted CXXCH cytochrome family protein
MLRQPVSVLCFSCHDELQQGRSVSKHSPFSQGECLECHEGHVSTHQKLLTDSREKLCYSCHEKAEYSQGQTVHAPAGENQCHTCHAPHTAAEASLQRLPQKELCLSCHEEISAEMNRLSNHVPFYQGKCTKCHNPHRGERQNFLRYSLNNGDLCFSCHTEEKQAAANDAAAHEPFSSGDCVLCHTSHSSDFWGLLKNVSGALCQECHDPPDNSVEHKPVQKQECTACHNPHGSAEDNFLKQPSPAICLSCHEETTRFWKEGFAHEPALEDCRTCHQAHGSNNSAILTVPPEELCRECHDIEESGFTELHKGIKPSAGSCRGCHDPHGGSDKSLLYPVIHKPFQQGDCEPCHTGGAK